MVIHEAPQAGMRGVNNTLISACIIIALCLFAGVVSAAPDNYTEWAAEGDHWIAHNTTYNLTMYNTTGAHVYNATSTMLDVLNQAAGASGAGGSANNGAGSGGAGGTQVLLNYTVTLYQLINLNVGTKGAAVIKDTVGNRGENSTFDGNIAWGGGYAATPDGDGGNGGSGGSAANTQVSGANRYGGSGIGGQGQRGGNVTYHAGVFNPGPSGGSNRSAGTSVDTAISLNAGNGTEGFDASEFGYTSDKIACSGGGGARDGLPGYALCGFGNGSASTSGATAHAATSPGSSGGGGAAYFAGADGGGASGADGMIIIRTLIEGGGELVADFAANQTSGYPNDYFQFTDLTTDLPLTWNWTFGDTGTSTDQNPIHQYTAVGSYTVALNVTNATTYNLTTKVGYITISELPAPSGLSISANKTYSTESPFPVLFTTSATDPRLSYRNLSFGDGDWYNTTVQTDTSITHTYTSVGDYNVSLYETNAAGMASTYITDFIVLSNPTLVMYPQDLPVSRGVTGLMTLRVSNLSHVDGGSTNITFNQTEITIDSITLNSTSSQNFTLSSVINNTAGTASIGVSCVDISSLSSNVDIANIVWRANVTKTNDTSPVSFNSTAFTSFVKSNSSYNSFRYPNITYLVPGAITLTDETWMRVLLFKNAYNLNPISGIQVRISYTGIISGSATTNTGSYDLSSTYGTASVTAAADGYYNVTQDVLFNGDGTDTFLMTPLSGAPGQTTWYVPQQVRIYAVNNMGAPIEGVYITCTPLDFTAPEDWTQILIGIQPSVNISGTTLDGFTGSDGSWVAPMLSSFRYRFNLLNASAGINHTVTFSPQDTSYRIYVTSSTPTNNTLTQVVQSSLPFYKLNSSGYYNLSMIYQDPQGYTSFLQFNVKDYTHGNTLVYTKNWTNPGTSIIVDNYTAYIPLGQEYNWQYNATKV